LITIHDVFVDNFLYNPSILTVGRKEAKRLQAAGLKGDFGIEFEL